jgi:hypothetical protein
MRVRTLARSDQLAEIYRPREEGDDYLAAVEHDFGVDQTHVEAVLSIFSVHTWKRAPPLVVALDSRHIALGGRRTTFRGCHDLLWGISWTTTILPSLCPAGPDDLVGDVGSSPFDKKSDLASQSY